MDGPFVESLMTRKVICVALDATLKDVVSKFHAYGISCVLVCEDGVPAGIITERDIVGVAFNQLSHEAETRTLAAELMSPLGATVRPDDSLSDAIALIQSERIRHLPVLGEDGRLAGLLTQTDLLRAALDLLD